MRLNRSSNVRANARQDQENLSVRGVGLGSSLPLFRVPIALSHYDYQAQHEIDEMIDRVKNDVHADRPAVRAEFLQAIDSTIETERDPTALLNSYQFQ